MGKHTKALEREYAKHTRHIRQVAPRAKLLTLKRAKRYLKHCIPVTSVCCEDNYNRVDTLDVEWYYIKHVKYNDQAVASGVLCELCGDGDAVGRTMAVKDGCIVAPDGEHPIYVLRPVQLNM